MARSAWRSASGRSCSVAGMPMSVTTGTASSGPTVTLSTGTVMSAAPKPTKPRMKPAAVTPSASSTSVGTGTDGISGPACPSPARPPAPGKRERRPSARSPPGAGMRAALPASSRQLPAGGGRRMPTRRRSDHRRLDPRQSMRHPATVRATPALAAGLHAPFGRFDSGRPAEQCPVPTASMSPVARWTTVLRCQLPM